MPIRLAVADIGAADQTEPEALDQLFGGEPAPLLGEIAFVADLVEDHRLQRWSSDGQRLASVRTIIVDPYLSYAEHGQFITTDLAGGDERAVFTFPRLIPNPNRCDFSWRPLP